MMLFSWGWVVGLPVARVLRVVRLVLLRLLGILGLRRGRLRLCLRVGWRLVGSILGGLSLVSGLRILLGVGFSLVRLRMVVVRLFGRCGVLVVCWRLLSLRLVWWLGLWHGQCDDERIADDNWTIDGGRCEFHDGGYNGGGHDGGVSDYSQQLDHRQRYGNFHQFG